MYSVQMYMCEYYILLKVEVVSPPASAYKLVLETREGEGKAETLNCSWAGQLPHILTRSIQYTGCPRLISRNKECPRLNIRTRECLSITMQGVPD